MRKQNFQINEIKKAIIKYSITIWKKYLVTFIGRLE